MKHPDSVGATAPHARGISSTVKADPVGFVQLGAPPSATYLGVVHSFAVYVKWSDLQPTPTGPIATNNPIDKAIARLRLVEQKNPGTHLNLKLRVMAGISSPTWAKKIGGPAVTIEDPKFTGVKGTIGRFWTNAFHKAYKGLMSKLAAKYDGVPELADVAMSRCMTITAEPMIRPFYDQTTVHNLLAAGYSAGKDKTCQQEQITDATLWTTTHSSLSFNGFVDLSSSGRRSMDWPFTRSLMDLCHHILGPRCTIENNDMVANPSAYYLQLYSSIASHGAPIAIQTDTLSRVGNLKTAISNAIHYGAQSLELTGGYANVVTPADLRRYLPQLLANSQVLP
jgi:hypothetical protein